MKRAIFPGALVIVVAALGACSDGPPRKVEPGSTQSHGWARPPEITAVRRGPATLIFSGTAEPGARVALSNDEGAAFAAAADAAGRFEIRMTAPREHLMLQPETRIGQDIAASPERLLILADGPIAVLRLGGATRRLDRAPSLGAVDSDGRSALASGVAADSAGRLSVTAGGQTVQVVPDARGRWSVVLSEGGAAGIVRVGDAAFDWPGPGISTSGIQAERAGAGWRVAWSGPSGGRQWTWLPDA
jgi:hypothetical protein